MNDIRCSSKVLLFDTALCRCQQSIQHQLRESRIAVIISFNEYLVQCTALHCTALHCTVLYCTALHCTALHCRGIPIHSILFISTTLKSTAITLRFIILTLTESPLFPFINHTETDDSDIKIADFGFAKKTSKLLPNESACGTPG